MYQETIRGLRRQIRGMEIASSNPQIKKVSKLNYKIRSQSNQEAWYDVRKKYGRNLGGRQDGKWICDCPDFQSRQADCKHIHAVLFFKKLGRETSLQEAHPPEAKPSSLSECARCKSGRIVKDGRRYNAKGPSQKYLCRVCGHRFVIDGAFKNAKTASKLICTSIDLYFKGVSLRKIADHIRQFYGVNVSHVSDQYLCM